VPVAQRTSPLDVDIDRLAPNEHQPRQHFDDARLEELVASIRAKGIIQPILVRKTGDTYRIIAGERRWRAAQRAGLHTVPVIVRDVPEGSGAELLELALIENLQRENLNPLEEAGAYQRLADEFHLTQDQIAAAVGKDRSSVTNTLRLLKLPDEVRGHLAAGAISAGHARAILGLTDPADQRHAAREVIGRGLSVRDTEALVRRMSKKPEPARQPAQPQPDAQPKDVHTRAAEDRMRFALGTQVRIVRNGERGTVEIDFSSEQELNRIYEHIVGQH
jgi:ParB family chromosome partitioning protein